MVKIGIFSETNESDSVSGRLLSQLESYPKDSYQWFDLRLTARAKVTISEQAIIWNGVDLSQLKIAVIQGFNYQNPVIPDSNDNKDWALWNADSISRQQKYSMLFSLFSELQRRGVMLINPLRTLIGNYMKVNCLDQIQGIGGQGEGIKAPEYICSNEIAQVQAFLQRNANSVWRPSTGRASWQLFMPKQCDELVSLQKPPVLVAQIVKGPLRRAYCINGQVVLLLNQAGPSDQAQLERLEMYQSTDYSVYQERLSQLCQQFNMPWGEILFVDTGNELVIYDLEPDPPIDSLPDYYADYLSQVMAEYIKSVAEQKTMNPIVLKDHSLEERVVQRTALFTRRMLRILFDFERSKYND